MAGALILFYDSEEFEMDYILGCINGYGKAQYYQGWGETTPNPEDAKVFKSRRNAKLAEDDGWLFMPRDFIISLTEFSQ